MIAVKATFAGVPVSMRCAYLAFISGLKRASATVDAVGRSTTLVYLRRAHAPVRSRRVSRLFSPIRERCGAMGDETLPPTPAPIATDRSGDAEANGIKIHYPI
jgi:hypothetical protein